MKPPQEFIDEYWQMRERMDWLRAGGIDGKDIGKAKLFVGYLLEFHEKWQPVIQDPELRRGLKAARAGFEALRAKLEAVYWAHLHEVIEARKEWFLAESIFQALVAVTVLRREMPEKLRPEFEKVLAEHSSGGIFDAEKEYRETEQDVTEAEAKFRKALAGLEVDWPERVDAALRTRLEALDGDKANGRRRLSPPKPQNWSKADSNPPETPKSLFSSHLPRNPDPLPVSSYRLPVPS
ncbi:MAG: hypothetical protein NTZ16_12380 [Verrucomicrobia bacterium]|nr:hypothetical protein [Verrucomicrobiota bacterium]